jgi:hypothetical protein
MLRVIQLSVVALVMAAATLPATAATPSTDANHCQQLISKYDRLGSAFDDAGRRRARDLGEAECRKGNFAAGENLLEMALMSVGYIPS